MVSSIDVSAARAWTCMAENFQHPTILLACQTTLRLLVQHLASLSSLPQHLVILKNLTSSLVVDAFSACLRNSSLTKAFELLEQGRGVFWSQLTRLHSRLDDLIGSESTHVCIRLARSQLWTCRTNMRVKLQCVKMVCGSDSHVPDRSTFCSPPCLVLFLYYNKVLTLSYIMARIRKGDAHRKVSQPTPKMAQGIIRQLIKGES